MPSHYQSHKKLFADFSKSSIKDWVELAKSALSPGDFEKFCSAKEIEGLAVKSLYTPEDLLKNTTEKHALSYTFPANKWAFQEIVQIKDYSGLYEANRLAHQALSGGAESLLFDISEVNAGDIDLDILLQDVYRDAVDISWRISSEIGLPEKNQLNKMRGMLYLNPLESYMTDGEPYQSGLEKLKWLFDQNYDTYRCLSVSSFQLANSGASIVQEIAYVGNLLIEYLDFLSDKGISAKRIFDNLEVTLSTRSPFLADIAKFRAMATVIYQIAEAYQVNLSERPLIRAVSAVYNKAGYDLNTNLLRNTSEALAAILGNCQTICLLPHNGKINDPNPFGKRLARNVSHLLREESHLHLVDDPLAGAYAIESMTQDIAEKSWSLLQETEARGGLLSDFESGHLQDAIQQSASSYLEEVASLRKVTVGANRYVPEDFTLAEGEPFTKLDLSTSSLPLLIHIRGAAQIEGIRRMVEEEVSAGKPRPKVGIMAFSKDTKAGVLAARSAFVSDILQAIGVSNVKLAAQYFIEDASHHIETKYLQALLVVGEDAEYKSREASNFKQLSEAYKLPLLIAGYPSPVTHQPHAYGVFAFLHAHMHVPAFADLFFQKINFFDL